MTSHGAGSRTRRLRASRAGKITPESISQLKRPFAVAGRPWQEYPTKRRVPRESQSSLDSRRLRLLNDTLLMNSRRKGETGICPVQGPEIAVPKRIAILLVVCLAMLGSIRNGVAADLSLQLPATVVEGYVLANGGKVVLSAPAVSDVSVALSSSDAGLVLPANVVILAGNTNAMFDVTLPDDLGVESTRSVTITASATGVTSATNTVSLVDNDPHHIRFAPVPWAVDTNGGGLELQIRAENADGTLQTN